MKYVQKHFWNEHLGLCALQVFLCALVSRHVCTRTRAQPIEGTWVEGERVME